MDARLFRAPFAPAVLLLGVLGYGLFRLGVAALGTLLDEPFLYDQFLSAFFERIVPVPSSVFRNRPHLGGGIDPFAFVALLAWAIGLWAVFGVAICRMVAVQLARRQWISPREALRFAWSTKWANLSYPVTAGAVLLALYLLNGVVGMLATIPWVGPIALLAAMPFVVIFALGFAILALGYVAGAGVATASLATERNGPLDAVGRTFDYLFRQPVYVLFALALLVLFAKLLHWVGAEVFLPTIERSLAFLLESDRLERMLDAALRRPGYDPDSLGATEAFAAWLLGLGLGILRAGIAGLIATVLLSASTFVYFRLRLEIDGIPFDDLDLGLRIEEPVTGVPGDLDEADPVADPPGTDPAPAPGSSAPTDPVTERGSGSGTEGTQKGGSSAHETP